MRLILILIASFLSLKMGSQNLSQENLNYLNMLPPEARAQVIGQLTAGDYVSNFVRCDSGTLTGYGSSEYRYNYFMGKLIV